MARIFLVTQLTCYFHFGQNILRSPVISLLNEEATARKVPSWLDPQSPESQLPVDTEKFNKRWPCNADHICTINSLIITTNFMFVLLFLAGFCGTTSGQVRLLYHYKHCSNQTLVSLEFLVPKVSISPPSTHKKRKEKPIPSFFSL
jgi:hypothetical protein